MSTPSLSVALCSYNGSKHLKAQLDSFARQTTLPTEVVISDDVSSDDTLSIAREFARQAPFPVRVEQNSVNLGYTKNFGRAVQLCTGDLIFLSDQDDVWHPEKLTRFVARFAEATAPGLVFCDANLVGEDLQPLGRTWWQSRQFDPPAQRRLTGPDGAGLILKNPTWFAAGATMAFSARFQPLAVRIPPGWTHDAWIATIVSLLAPVSLVPEPLNDYRQHTSQVFGGSASQAAINQQARHRGATADHFLSTVDRYITLQQQLTQLGFAIAPRFEREIAGKIAHWSARAQMRRGSKAWRLPAIGRELLTGHYHRYSQGWKSMAMDVLI